MMRQEAVKPENNWNALSREHSLWIYHLALSCCALEVGAASGPRFDWERLGCKFVSDHRNADVLLVSGPVTKGLVPELKRIYQEMRAPKFVVAVGSCASTGGMFGMDSATGIEGLNQYIPTDVFVPGCPPRPESIIHAIQRLQEKVGALKK
jgi:NADH-quinone oxidoreductase B subunit